MFIFKRILLAVGLCACSLLAEAKVYEFTPESFAKTVTAQSEDGDITITLLQGNGTKIPNTSLNVNFYYQNAFKISSANSQIVCVEFCGTLSSTASIAAPELWKETELVSTPKYLSFNSKSDKVSESGKVDRNRTHITLKYDASTDISFVSNREQNTPLTKIIVTTLDKVVEEVTPKLSVAIELPASVPMHLDAAHADHEILACFEPEGSATAAENDYSVVGNGSVVFKVSEAGTLHVYTRSGDKKSAVQSFVFKKPTSSDTTTMPLVMEPEPEAEWYDLNGRRVNNPSRGVYVRRIGNQGTVHRL